MKKPKSHLYDDKIDLFKKRRYAGIHLIVDFWFGEIIEKEEKIKKILWKAGENSNNTPLRIVFHKFNPQGLTAVLLLAESHIAIHTWPEINYVGLDIFSCGAKSNPYQALEYLKKEFKPKLVKMKEIKRGVKIKNCSS